MGRKALAGEMIGSKIVEWKQSKCQSRIKYVTSHGKTYTNVLTFNGLKRQLAVSHRQSAVSNPLVNVRRFHQTVRRFCQTVRRIHQTVRRIQQTVSSMEKALVVTL